MAQICVCKYPLIIIDNREGKAVEYIAMPTDVISDTDIPLPFIEPIETEGPDGVVRKYISVRWQEIPQDVDNKCDGDKCNGIAKRYDHDIPEHIVIAGCNASEISIIDGEMKCDIKSIYTVLHTWEDWRDFHFIQLPCK